MASRSTWKTRRTAVPPGRIRLIPLSSVGLEFAFLDSEGEVRKRANKRPEPYNVDVAFGAVLPDLLARAHAVAAQERRRPREDAGVGSRGGGFRRTFSAGVATPLSVLLSTSGIQVPAHLLAGFLSATSSLAERALDIPPSELRKARRASEVVPAAERQRGAGRHVGRAFRPRTVPCGF